MEVITVLRHVVQLQGAEQITQTVVRKLENLGYVGELK